MLPLLFYRIKENTIKLGASWDKLAPSENAAIEFAHTYLNTDPHRFNTKQQYTMEFYLACKGDDINTRYRNNIPTQEDLQVAETLKEYKSQKDLVLYRGVCDEIFLLMKKNGKNHTDCDLYEKGFMACSLVKGHEYRSSKYLRIYIPKGTNVIYQGNINNEQNTYEVDIQYGAKLKIVSADNKYINCKLIETK